MFGHTLSAEIKNLARIPLKTNLQRAIEKDDQDKPKGADLSAFKLGPVKENLHGIGYRGDNNVSIPHNLESGQLAADPMQSTMGLEEEIEDFENLESYDFC